MSLAQEPHVLGAGAVVRVGARLNGRARSAAASGAPVGSMVPPLLLARARGDDTAVCRVPHSLSFPFPQEFSKAETYNTHGLSLSTPRPAAMRPEDAVHREPGLELRPRAPREGRRSEEPKGTTLQTLQ